MKTENINEMLKSAVSNAAPDVLDNVLHACDHEKGKVIYMEKKKNRSFAGFAAVAAVFVLLIAGIFIAKNNGFGITNNSLAAVVSFDVNPSIELKVDNEEDVISVKGLNDDGKKVLEGMDLEDTDLEVAVNAIIGSMLKHGYINEMANSILLSVSGVEGYDADALETKLANEVNALLKNGAVLSQNVSNADDKLVKLADEYGITVGKAALIQEIVKNSKTHTFEQLAGLTINELNLISNNSKLGNIKSEGEASSKSYIGKDAALSAALKAAGLGKDQVKDIEIELDYEHGVMVYEVEFDRGFDEYSYDIDAKTGEVVAYDNEINGKEVEFDSNTNCNGKGHHDDDDDDDDKVVNVPAEDVIGKDAAKSAALKHAGLTAAQVTELSVELDRENGKLVYDVEFKSAGYEYDYEIDAAKGSILKSDKELDG